MSPSGQAGAHGADEGWDAAPTAARRQAVDGTVHRAARRHPDKMAVIAGETKWTYRELDHTIDRVAAGLHRAGVQPGDRIALLARNSHWYVALRYAVSRAGAIFVPVNFMLSRDEVGYILSHSGVSILFVDGTCCNVGIAAARETAVRACFSIPDINGVEASTPGLEPFDRLIEGAAGRNAVDYPIAQIIYTSGTESRPKGAALTHDAIVWQYQSCIAACGWRGDAVVVNALPLFHCAQLDAFLGPSLSVGATNIILDGPAPALVLPAIERARATSMFAPPTGWIDLLRSPLLDRHDLSSLTHGYYGASIMPGQVLRELTERLPGIRLWNVYGQTEIAPVAVVLQPEDQQRKPGSVGQPVLNVETRVVDDEMADVEPGEIGEIVHRSPHLMSGYWRDPERTAEAFADGWFHSGDLATIDDEGYITVVDRKKDMIKSGGENVSSREVEDEIYRLADVSEVAVIGIPDPRWIELVTAFVVPRSGAVLDEQAVIRHCRARLAGFKTPKRVLFVDALPRNASGKILKRDLREHVDR